MSETRRKLNPTNIPKIKDYIAKIEAEISETRELAGAKDRPEWEKMKKLLERKLSVLEYDLDNFDRRTEDGSAFVIEEKVLYSCLQARRDIKFFIQLVEGGEKTIEVLNNKLAQAKEKLKEYEQRAE